MANGTALDRACLGYWQVTLLEATMDTFKAQTAPREKLEQAPDPHSASEWQAAMTSGLVISALSWVVFLSEPKKDNQRPGDL